MIVQVFNCLSDLSDDDSSLVFGKYFVFLKLGIESTLLHILQHDV